MTKYVLASQGIKLFDTEDFMAAFDFYMKSNDEWREYCQHCADEYEVPADNEVFMYKEIDDGEARELSFEQIMRMKEKYK